jgi:hypothetical protein
MDRLNEGMWELDSVRHGRVDHHEPVWRSIGATILYQRNHFLQGSVLGEDVFTLSAAPQFSSYSI